MKILRKPVLWLLIERLEKSKLIDKIVVATTANSEDILIVKLCREIGVDVFLGSEEDVLDRYYKAAKQYNAEVIVRITADCPLVDPKVTDRVIEHYLKNKDKFDYVSTNHPATFPDGLDVEVFSFKSLEKAWRNAKKQYEREHVTPYIWDQPDKFKIGNVENDEDLSLKERWTLDYEEDFRFIKAIYEHLYKEGEVFFMDDVLRLLKEKPELRKINEKYVGFTWYTLQQHLDELKTVEKSKYKPSPA